MPRWISDEPGEEAALLQALGITDSELLFADVPKKVRMGRMGIGPSHSELEVTAEVNRTLERNRPLTRFASFVGGRIAVRHIPAAVDAILQRSEFYTSYTPYQPEASQGMLQALYEFQSLWVELSGLDAANASLYDGATAAGEAMLLARRVHDGHRFLVPASLPWEERSVLASYGSGQGIRVEEIPYDPRTGVLDLAAAVTLVASGDVCGVLVDVPNGFGHLDDGLLDLKSRLGEIPLVVAADPLALTVLEPPGSWGADIVVGEGQGFGAGPSFGGPLLGLLACRRELLHSTPGRIVGRTVDRDGRRAYTLTLQTREQHIRRSRATSNICTNQSLLALAFVVYASVVGPRGLAELQSRLAERARTLASALGGIDGLTSPRFDAPYLGDFTIELTKGTARDFLERMRRRRILAGQSLADPRPAHSGAGPARLLVSVGEFVDDKAIQKYATAARAVVPGLGAGSA